MKELRGKASGSLVMKVLAEGLRDAAALSSLVLVLLATARASAAPPPPPWSVMAKDARATFTRADDSKIERIVRVGQAEITGRRTSVDVIPTVYQDAAIYYVAKFGQIETQGLTLHYEWNLGGWSFVGFEWGEAKVVRKGNYPAPPSLPTAGEIEDAVKDGMRDWHVKPEHVESVKATGKPTFEWLDDKPTASYKIPVKVSVKDVVDRSSLYQVQWKTRFVCTFKASLVLEADAWALRSTDPDCAARNCSVVSLCQDLWSGHAGGKARKR